MIDLEIQSTLFFSKTVKECTTFRKKSFYNGTVQLTDGNCHCQKFYDGLDDGLLNVNNGYLLSHTLLLGLMAQFMEGE
jgi:hypothetical protein